MPDWQVHAGTGPYLLLVHGFLSSRAQWLLNLEGLAAGCTPVTLELFGHHQSPSPADPDCFRPAYYVRCFEQIRDQLGADRWFVLGYSLGAGITLRYALDHPERISGHLFTNSTSGLADENLQAEFSKNSQEATRRIREGGLQAMERIPVHPRHGRKLPEPVYQALIADAAEHDPGGIANTIAVTTPEASMRARLSENTRPACMIWGTRENRFQASAEYAQANMPGLSTVALDAGHGMNMEAADSFNSAVLEFINRCPN